MMNASPIFEDPPPPGYISAKAKSNFILAASVLAGFFFLGQFIIPQVVWLFFMPSMMFSGFDVEQPRVERCTFWNGQLWYPEESMKGFRNKRTRLRSLSLGSENEPAPGVEVGMSPPWLLSDDETLWLISPGAVGFYEAGSVTIVKPRKRLGTISRPFWYSGNPAVVEKTPGGHTLLIFIDGEWEKEASLKLTDAPDAMSQPGNNSVNSVQWQAQYSTNADTDLQIVAIGNDFHVFMRDGETIYYREGLGIFIESTDSSGESKEETQQDQRKENVQQKKTDSEENGKNEWQVVDHIDGGWFALELDGEPVIFHAGDTFSSSGVTGLKLQNGRWDPFFFDSKTRASELGVCELDEPGHFVIMAWSFPGRLSIVKVADEVVTGRRKFGGMFPFDMKQFFWMYAVMIAIPAVMSLVLVFILSALMSRYRQCEFVSGTDSIRFASLTRRAVAKLIDSLISTAPTVPILYIVLKDFDFETLFDSLDMFFQQIRTVLIWTGVATCWGLFVLLVFSFFEGTWGFTPGKWIAGIRVYGTDLKPRGFLRALVRNFLIIIDGLFNYLVGILLIVFSQNWQRLGDLAAGTIVVHSGQPHRNAEKH